MTAIDGPGGWIGPNHINDQGQVVGEATSSPNAQTTFGVVWSVSGGPSTVTASGVSVGNVMANK